MHEAKTNTLFSSLVFLLNHFLLSHCSPLSNYFLLSFCRSIRLFLLFTPTQSALSFLFPVFHSSFCHLSCSRPSFTTLINFSHFLPLTADVLSMLLITSNLFFFSTLQKRKTTTISVEVKKSQHKYIIGPKGNTLQEILETTGVSVEMPPLDSGSETIILRGEPDKLGPALTQVYAKVRRKIMSNCFFKI